ncbi:MAG: DUF4230 domain-containing protein [Bacteroidota bacterium]
MNNGIKIVMVLLVLFIPFLAYKCYDWGKASGYKSGYTTGENDEKEKKLVANFKQQFDNATEMYKKASLQESVQLNTLKIELDHRGLVKKLSRAAYKDDKQAQKVFSDVVYEVNSRSLVQLASRLQLKPSDVQVVKAVYDSIHPTIVVDYHNRFKAGMVSRGKIDPITERKAYNAADQFNMTLSEGFCDLVSIVAILSTMPSQSLAISKTGKDLLFAISCPELLNSIFPTLSLSLHEAGAYIDMQSLEVALDGYLRKSIAEIATVQEVYDNIKTTKIVERVLFEKSKLYREWIGDTFDSKATIEITASAKVKAGIDIDDYFQYKVFPDQSLISITVAEPKVLSREIFPHFTKVEEGYLVQINEAMLNDAKLDVNRKLNKSLKQGNILVNAKSNFEQFFEAVILPTLKYSGVRKVRFNYINPRKISKPKSTLKS